MTTEQQAREALTVLLASVRVEGHHLDRAEDARKTLQSFITQAAEDKVKLELYSSLASKYEELRALIDNGHESYTHDDALFRVAEDRRIADAVRGAQLGFQCLNSGRTIVVEQHDKVASHGFRNVLILPADAVGGGE